MKYVINYFSAAYGEGTYNSDVYNATDTASNTGTTPGTTTGTTTPANADQSGGVLANTGLELVAGATLGSLIIFTALIVRIWKRPSKKPQA